jgi:hypothetical protein
LLDLIAVGTLAVQRRTDVSVNALFQFRESNEKQEKYAEKLAKMKKDAEEYVSQDKLFRSERISSVSDFIDNHVLTM